MLIAVLAIVCTVLSPNGTVSAIFGTISFIVWFCAIMLPDEEKYKQV